MLSSISPLRRISSSKANSVIVGDTALCISIASFWEIMIKQQIKNNRVYLNCSRIINDTPAREITRTGDPSASIDIDPEALYKCEAISEPLQVSRNSSEASPPGAGMRCLYSVEIRGQEIFQLCYTGF